MLLVPLILIRWIVIYPVDSAIQHLSTHGQEVSRCSRAKQRQRNVQKKRALHAKMLFLLIRPIVVFHHSPALPSPLSITRFYISFEQTIISGGRYYQNFTVLTERVTTWIFTGTLKRLNTHLCQ